MEANPRNHRHPKPWVSSSVKILMYPCLSFGGQFNLALYLRTPLSNTWPGSYFWFSSLMDFR